MKQKIFRNLFAVGVGIMILCVGLFLGILYQYFEGQLMNSLASETLLAARGVEALGQDYLEGLESNHRFTWVDIDGNVLYDSAANTQDMENHGDRKEIQEALSNQSGTSIRYSSTLSQRTLYFARRLADGSVLRLASAQYTVAILLQSLLPSILLILILAIVLSLFLASRLTHGIIRPILDLDLEHPEQAATYDELAPLLTRIKRQNDTISEQIEQLKQKQIEFTTITENMSEGLLLLDRQGRILSYNSGALLLLHAQPPDDRANYLTLNSSEVFCRAVEWALAGKTCQQLLDIENHCCQILANPVWKDGQTAGVVVVVLDVTEREQREELRREFTANVSHELRTPLTAISGIAEILKDGLVRTEDVKGFAADIYREAQRLISLVQDIIHLSELDEDSPTLEMQPVDLHELATTVVQRLAAPAAAAQVQLEVLGQSTQVRGVPHILDEILYNLCDNAIKYNRPNGQVKLTTQHTDRGIELTVADTGIGIPPHDRSRVFERFYRVDKSHSKAIGGTGLGLSIVKHGAAFHNAQLELNSQLDVGTTIRLIFPSPNP